MSNKYIRLGIVVLSAFVAVAPAFTVFAAPGVPRMLNYQGRLLSSGGALLGGSGTEYCFKFSFYDAQTVGSGTKLWPSGAPSTMTASVRSGVFTLGIGDTNIGGDVLDFNFQDTDTAYLNVEVAEKVGATCAPGDGAESFETFSPRQRILASGYAINASMVGGFSALQHASGNQIPVLSSGNLILGGTDPILSATTTNALTLQGSSSGDLRFFSASNRITASGDAIFAGEVSAVGVSTTNATTSQLIVSSSFTFGSASGILKAVAGVVTSTFVNLATDVTGFLGVSNGGTGTSTAPSYGQVLLGNALGGYDLVATSSLGIQGGGGGTWGSITGTLSDQTDLQAALDARLTLTEWYATTTDGLAEGATNRYYTDALVNSFVAGSTTIPKTYASNVFGGVQTFENASTTNISASYASSTEGFFGSLSIGNLTGVLRATAGSIATALVDLATDVTGILGISNGGTGTSTAPTQGQLLVGNAIGGYDLLATSSLAIDVADTTGVLDESRGGTGESNYALGDILYASGAGTLARLPIGNAGEVLKVTGGIPGWGIDLSGGGGGGIVGAWSTTTNNLAIYPANTAHVVVVGAGSTSTVNSIFEVSGRSYFSNNVGIGTTSPGSLLSIGGVANFDAGGSTLYSSLSVPSLSVGSLTGVLRASAGVVSAALVDLATDVTGILQVANGGTGWDEIESGTLLTGNGTGAVATTTIDASLQLSGGTLALNTGNVNVWTGLQAFSFASSSVFSAGRASFGETATTTIDTAGNVVVAGTLNVEGDTTLFTATTTNLMVTASSTFQDFTSRNATSSLLFTSAFRGAGLSGCDTAGDKLLWNSLTGQFSCGVDTAGSGGITSLGAAGQLQTGATQTFATSSDTNLGITITSAGDTHTFATNWLGTLAVGRGGTGWGNIESGTLLTGNGAGALATTSVGASLQLSGATLGLNLASANLWSGLQRFGSGASTTALSANDFVAVGRTATTTIRGEANATSTFAGAVSFTSASTTATSTLAGVRLSNIQNCTRALETDALGNVVCGTDTGVDGVTVTTFTNNSTWTKSNYTGLTFTQVIVTGGGGGGGGADGGDTASETAGGGGGAGATTIEMIPSASLGSTESVAVGTGGTGGSNTGGNGTAGNTSSFGSTLLSAPGGNLGSGATTLNVCDVSGAGGAQSATSTDGDISIPGGGGHGGTCAAETSNGGNGGASYWGGGARGGAVNAAGVSAGASATAYGAGGGGGAAVDNTGGAVGGAGSPGVVVTMNYTSSGGDFAEWYETKDDVEAGDVVAISTASYEYDSKLGLQKSAILEKATARSSVVGVVSSAPYETIGMDILGKATHPRPVALAGRVPVKLSLENGDVKAGDLLTVSSNPGHAMRSTKAGVTIGRALDDMRCAEDGSACTVLILVNTSYSTGALLNEAFSGVGIEHDTIVPGIDLGRMFLAEMMQKKQDITASTTLSEVSTDRLAAGLEVISPRVIAETLVVDAIEPFDKDVSMRLTDDGMFVIERIGSEALSFTFGTTSTTTASRALSVDALGNAIFAGDLLAANMEIGSREKPGGLTMYDSETGEPYCSRIVYGRLETFAGSCAEIRDIFGDEPDEVEVTEETPPAPEVIVPSEESPAEGDSESNETPETTPELGASSPDEVPEETPETAPASEDPRAEDSAPELVPEPTPESSSISDASAQ